MWCLWVRKLHSAFLDGELDSKRRSSVSDHVRRCRWCRHDLRRVERGARLAQNARTVEIPPPGRAAAAMAMAIAAAGERSATRPARTWQPRLLVPAALVPLALLLILSRDNSELRRQFWPLAGNNTVYALDFGLELSRGDDNLLNAFRARYAGKFREFPHQGPIDPSWVPYAVKFPTRLPPQMELRSVMIFDPKYCGSLVLNFADGERKLHILQQPADKPISMSGLKTTQAEVCKYNATHGEIGAYSIVTWSADDIRSVLLSNLDRRAIEGIVDSLR